MFLIAYAKRTGSVILKEILLSLKKYIYISYIYMYTIVFLLYLIKSWERTSKTDGEIGEHKLNEMGALWNLKSETN